MSDETFLDCESVLRDLFAWVDGELGDDRRKEMSDHLQRCRSCFSRAEFESRLKTHLREVGGVPVPLQVERRIRSVISRLTDR